MNPFRPPRFFSAPASVTLPPPAPERRVYPRVEIRRTHPALRGDGYRLGQRRPGDRDFCRVNWQGRFIKAESQLLEVAHRLCLSNAEAVAHAVGGLVPRTVPSPVSREVERPLSAAFLEPFPVEPSAACQ